MLKAGIEFKKLKVLFVNPYHKEWTNVLPLGIAYLAAILRDKGCRVNVIDDSVGNAGSLKIAKEVDKIRPDILAITSSTPQIYMAWEILRRVKDLDKRIITILGGAHPTALPEESLSYKFVDFVCRGEGEETISEFADTIINGSDDFGAIAGLSYKKDGQIIHNSPRKFLYDLDKLPYPARELFPFPEKYYSPLMIRKRYANIITSRGCPGGCLFCNKNIFGSTFRARSPENVVAEMEYLINAYGIEEFHMSDDCFAWDTQRVMDICNLIIKKRLKIKWACSNGIRVDRGSMEMYRIMKESGCYRVAFGVESGDEEILKRIGKRIKLEQVKMAFENAQKMGMITVALFMLGNYGENERTMRKTIDFAKSLKTDYAQFAITLPYPGTALYRLIEREGKFLSRDWSRYDIFDEPVVFELHEVKKDLLVKMFKCAHREFYYRPRQILLILRKRFRYFSIRDLIRFFDTAVRVVKRSFAKGVAQ